MSGTRNGIVKDGFDYSLQVWVKDYIIQPCGHPDSMGAHCCNGRISQGQDIRIITEMAILNEWLENDGMVDSDLL